MVSYHLRFFEWVLEIRIEVKKMIFCILDDLVAADISRSHRAFIASARFEPRSTCAAPCARGSARPACTIYQSTCPTIYHIDLSSRTLFFSWSESGIQKEVFVYSTLEVVFIGTGMGSSPKRKYFSTEISSNLVHFNISGTRYRPV